MDLSKSYDCLPHDLLITKFSAYGFQNSATSLISNYLSNYLSRRHERVKIESAFSFYFEILRSVLQGSILDRLYLTSL